MRERERERVNREGVRGKREGKERVAVRGEGRGGECEGESGR